MHKPHTLSPRAASPNSLSGSDRRRERRYQVDLPGTAQLADIAHAVVISDLSLEGALVTSDAVFPAGAVITLSIEGYGTIDARVVHAGKGFSGVQFLNAHLHRDRLGTWMRTEITSP